jgi:hypothetical protein
MKFTWEPKDIICGRIVCKPNLVDDEFTPCGWTAKWTYKMGWLAAGNPQKEYYPIKGDSRKEREEYIEKHRADYCAIAMTDGMITSPRTKKEMADWLNSENMIPMPQEWFLETISYLRHLN